MILHKVFAITQASGERAEAIFFEDLLLLQSIIFSLFTQAALILHSSTARAVHFRMQVLAGLMLISNNYNKTKDWALVQNAALTI